MSEMAKLLRFLVQGDKEAKITQVSASITATKFTPQLTYARKGMAVYNNSNDASGECYYGFTATMSPSGESMPIPKGAVVNIPVSTDIDVYFLSFSGEVGQQGDLRVIEIS